MCQGVFPSAFNPCDCSSSELPPYAQPKSKQIEAKAQPKSKRCSSHPHVVTSHHNLKELPHLQTPHPQSSKLQNLAPFSPSALLAKWVATPASDMHHYVDSALKQEQQHDLHHGQGMPAGGGPAMSTTSSSRKPARLDTPHLIHAFFFDST